VVDVLCVVRLADVAGVDLGAEVLVELARTESRFPADGFGVSPLTGTEIAAA
jgi:hypothetical protein